MKYKLLIADEKGNVRTVVENIEGDKKSIESHGDNYIGIQNIYEDGAEEMSSEEILKDIKNTILQMEKG